MSKRVHYKTFIDEGQVKFAIGHQTFALDYKPHEDRDYTDAEQLEWMRQQIEHALSQLGDYNSGN